ncbi:MAG: asparagine synthase-related protein [Pseudomonadota bacterium]
MAMGLARFRADPGSKRREGPLIGAGDRYLLAADISIHDRSGIARRLSLQSVDSAGREDAQLLLAAWERWEEDCLSWLNADFAFALWDRDRQELVLSRDFLGNRPLFYHRSSDGIAVASMPAGLLALPHIPCRPNREALSKFVAIAPPEGPEWFFEGVKRVMPGQVLRLSTNGERASTHWQPKRKVLELLRPDDYVDAVQEALDRAVANRLVPGVATGCHLSAGLDSGAVMASIAVQLPADERLSAFTAAAPDGFEAPEPSFRLYDEAPLAAEAVERYANVDHVILRSEGSDVTAIWDKAFWLFQAPLPNACNFLWVGAINDAAQARGVRRMMSATLGNTSFSYTPPTHLANLLTSGRLLTVARELRASHHLGASFPNLLRGTLRPLMPIQMLKAIAARGGRPTSSAGMHFGSDKSVGLSDANILGIYPRDGWEERVGGISLVDLGVYLKGMLAGWGIDECDPTADKDLFELCLSIPDDIYHRNGQSRALARAMLADRLPESVLAERRRGYQSPDWRQSVHAGLTALRSENARARHSVESSRLLNLDGIDDALNNIGSDLRPGQADEILIRRGVLRGLAGAHFIRKATGQN